MSNKSLAKKIKEKFQKKSEPRTIPEIQKVYNEVSAKAGQAQYQLYVFNKELEQLNSNLMSLNQEAAARLALDKEIEAQTKAAAPEETK